MEFSDGRAMRDIPSCHYDKIIAELPNRNYRSPIGLLLLILISARTEEGRILYRDLRIATFRLAAPPPSGKKTRRDLEVLQDSPECIEARDYACITLQENRLAVKRE